MFRKVPDPDDRASLPAGTRRLLWLVCLLDAMALVWMVALGDWLDSALLITSVITFGGRHEIVLTIALVGFLLLAGLAPVTRGFAVASRAQYAAMAVAGVLSVIALAGVISVIGLVVGAILLAAHLFRSVASGTIRIFHR
jgi:hypothetical protein